MTIFIPPLDPFIPIHPTYYPTFTDRLHQIKEKIQVIETLLKEKHLYPKTDPKGLRARVNWDIGALKEEELDIADYPKLIASPIHPLKKILQRKAYEINPLLLIAPHEFEINTIPDPDVCSPEEWEGFQSQVHTFLSHRNFPKEIDNLPFFATLWQATPELWEKTIHFILAHHSAHKVLGHHKTVDPSYWIFATTGAISSFVIGYYHLNRMAHHLSTFAFTSFLDDISSVFYLVPIVYGLCFFAPRFATRQNSFNKEKKADLFALNVLEGVEGAKHWLDCKEKMYKRVRKGQMDFRTLMFHPEIFFNIPLSHPKPNTRIAYIEEAFEERASQR